MVAIRPAGFRKAYKIQAAKRHHVQSRTDFPLIMRSVHFSHFIPESITNYRIHGLHTPIPLNDHRWLMVS